jgi:hypothetical protein
MSDETDAADQIRRTDEKLRRVTELILKGLRDQAGREEKQRRR